MLLSTKTKSPVDPPLKKTVNGLDQAGRYVKGRVKFGAEYGVTNADRMLTGNIYTDDGSKSYNFQARSGFRFSRLLQGKTMLHGIFACGKCTDLIKNQYLKNPHFVGEVKIDKKL